MASFGSRIHVPRPSTRVQKPPAMRVPAQRRDYAKAEQTAENPLATPKTPSFGSTGLPPGLPGE